MDIPPCADAMYRTTVGVTLCVTHTYILATLSIEKIIDDNIDLIEILDGIDYSPMENIPRANGLV